MPIRTCETAADVPDRKLESPLYAAVSECDPTARAPVENAALPAVNTAEPNCVVPSEKTTVPDAPANATVAVSATVCPEREGFGVEVNVTGAMAFATVCVITGEELPL